MQTAESRRPFRPGLTRAILTGAASGARASRSRDIRRPPGAQAPRSRDIRRPPSAQAPRSRDISRPPCLGLHVFGGLVMLAVGLGSAAGTALASWAPEVVGGTVAGVFESRPIEGTEAAIDPAAGTGDGRYWFAPPEDWGGSLEVWSRWKFRSALGKSKVKLSYARNDWAEGGIFAQDAFGLDLTHDLGAGFEFAADVEYAPEVYKRHRADKDALPGEPRFRPETFSDLEMELSLGKSFGPLTTLLLGAIERRDENRWFEERDRSGRGLGAGLEFGLWNGSAFRPTFLRSRIESRNEPDLGSDLSFDEDSYALRYLQDLGDFRAEFYGKVDLRAYTTTDPDDDNRFGREDTGRYLSGKLSWRAAAFRPFVGYEISRSSSELPGVAAEDQDDGEDERSLARLGVDVQWELPRFD